MYLHLVSKKSIWKNRVWRTEFLVYFEVDFYCMCSLQKSITKIDFCRLKIQFVELDFYSWFFKKSSTDQQRENPAHFLSAQMFVLSRFFQAFIVLWIYILWTAFGILHGKIVGKKKKRAGKFRTNLVCALFLSRT